MGWPETVLGAYVGVLGLLSLNGIHRMWMVRAWLRHRPLAPRPLPEDPPTVTIQLPIYNETYVVERLIERSPDASTRADRLEIQVLDDSTDETCGIARACVERRRASRASTSSTSTATEPARATRPARWSTG